MAITIKIHVVYLRECMGFYKLIEYKFQSSGGETCLPRFNPITTIINGKLNDIYLSVSKG